MNGRYFIAGAVSAVFVATVVFMDPSLLTSLTCVALFWIAVPATVISVILLLFAAGTRRSHRPPLTILSYVLAFSVFVAATIPANRLIQERSVVAAKAYPARIAPLLEAYRK